jgi:HAD superfamily phosphatase (TIGR01668 family)
MCLFRPTYYSKSIYDVPLSFYEENNIKIIFSDLDNTLDAFFEKEPTKRALKLVEDLKSVGVTLIITSNNHGDRVKNYAKKLGVECHYSSKKPLGYKLRRFIKNKNLNKKEILMVGDQILTDVISSKLTGVRVLLVEPVVNKDLVITKFNRFIDKIISWFQHKFKILEKREVTNNGKK